MKGCQSQVWLDADFVDGPCITMRIPIRVITKGMIALFIRVLTAKSRTRYSRRLELHRPHRAEGAPCPTRANAFSLMATQMKQRALEFASR